ncbi:TonB-dependent receptor [Flavobacterium micromati]|uniref:TonB-dependent receptor n=1 Tax=Flavobacterium micromati TaxID=229205 RepID=A0A1M5NHF9_9FLAO|nr:TonB-dependent receptor [Flavobacterium micromati]SHG88968.1 TonB-dependent receptor [Flavobacterium micromati]
MKFKLLFFAFLITSFSFAQNKGTVSGTLTDKESNNQSLPFANVLIKGTTLGTNTDIDGKYTLKIQPGNYVLQLSFVGYEAIEVAITIIADEVVIVDRALGSGSYKLEDVVIKTVRKRNTETAIMMEIKEAKQVVSAISAEQISKGTDGNAAEAVQRVPGITIVDGKFVMIRGLSERYNNVLLNNSIAPSTEIDKRTFAFDLISTSALDKMLIYKTGSADKPGDFAGGIIAVTTAENTSEFTKLDVGFGFRPGTTFDTYQQSEGSNTDFLGFDNSFRTLPNNFSAVGGVVPASVANRLPNNFSPTGSTAIFDNSIGFSLGRKIKLGSNASLFAINSLSYSNSYQYINREFSRYTTLNAGQTEAPLWFRYNDDIYQNEINATVLSNWILKIGDHSKIKFKNLFNQKGRNETTIRNGNNFLQRGDDLLRNYYLIYQSRSLYTGQLEGEHKLNSKSDLDWVVGFNSLTDNVPDFRRYRTFKQSNNPNDPYIMIDPPSSNPFDAGRYYGELSEYSINNGANYTYTIEQFKNDEEVGNIVLKAGYYASYRTRDFSAKYFTYLIPGYVAFDRAEELRRLPLNEVFNATNVNDTDGWSLREGTRPEDSYKADNTYLAGYIQGEIPLKRFDVTAGIRVENNIQTLDSRDAIRAINVNNPITSILPSLNVGYNVSEKSLMRFAYSRTVNRPEFRELAPFLFYDYTNDVNIQGNPNLKIANINNLDMRYEFYPSKSETISFGAFYKQFDTPIELTTVIVGENPQFVYNNATSANNYGVELELKKSFKGLTNSTFVDRFSININGSYIISEVDLGTAAVAQQRTRALQGQSPYIINGALGYQDENDFSINLVYNRFGDRIFSVSDDNFPSIYELSRNNLDMTFSKKIKKATFKVGVQNLLNDKYRFFEDSDRNEKIEKNKDNATSVFKRGTLLTLNITYNL